MKKIIHLSDLHFRKNWEEDQSLVLDAFFKDLSKQISSNQIKDTYLAFTGDLVQAGGDIELYNLFLDKFDTELNKIGITKEQRICIPGNHDVSVNYISQRNVEHEGVVSQKLKEWQFNDYISTKENLLIGKFKNYIDFESNFAKYNLTKDKITGRGWLLDENIGVYALNTALCSSGGFNQINDERRLAIDTRNLQKWISECKASTKILLMHHPLEFLTDWAKTQLQNTLQNHFSLCLSGHVHDQTYFHAITKDLQLINCSAPPLLTDKGGELGYSIITVSEKGVIDIQYRQWTKRNSFVTGVNFSDTDDGKIIIQVLEEGEKSAPFQSKEINDFVGRVLSTRLKESLLSFSSQPTVWVDPIVCKTNKITKNTEGEIENTVSIDEIISTSESIIIKAPPQFGLTCLSFHVAKEAWMKNSELWIYLDAKQVEWHSVSNAVKKELDVLALSQENIKGIILDSWNSVEKDSMKLLKKVSDYCNNKPLIVMNTIDDSQFGKDSEDINVERNFTELHLLALPRGHIRKVVSAYNDEKHIGDEEAIIAKVVSDLEVLNLHRTPLNCLTLLKVSEKYFDESPVNRAEMIKMVLLLLFNSDGIPTYKSIPDLKDCEFVLGRFCEKMIRSENYVFTRENFIQELKNYCIERVIDLEVEVVFDVLHNNNIIIRRGNNYAFRFSYWIYYFAAQRMQQDEEFAEYIFEDKRYISFPEIIEFYTGIDRSKSDALEILLNDLKSTNDCVYEKVGMPDGINPFRFINWSPTEEGVSKMKNEIGENVQKSNLPDSVKDQFADRSYNPVRAYDQSIHKILQEYSVITLWQSVKSASRALRNSDYVDPETKRSLLREIFRSWEQMSKVILAITPILAIKGNAVYGGINFFLAGQFGDTIEERIQSIWEEIPYNIMDWFGRDLFSKKMGPLLYEHFNVEEDPLKKHEIAYLLIHERPREWQIQIQNYVNSIPKNSFYLYDVYNALRVQYKYAFVSPKTLHEIKYLIKMCVAKHELGGKTISPSMVKKVLDSALPDRKVDNE